MVTLEIQVWKQFTLYCFRMQGVISRHCSLGIETTKWQRLLDNLSVVRLWVATIIGIDELFLLGKGGDASKEKQSLYTGGE